MAMTILVIGMTAIISMLTFGAALTRTASLRSASSAAVEAVYLDLQETLFPLEEDGTVGEPREIEERPVPNAPAVVYSATATQSPSHPREYRVDVEMSWRASGVRRTRGFTTILLREVPFGERMRRRFVEGRTDL